MAGMEGNVILLTSRGEDGTLARDLFDAWQASQDSERQYGTGKIGFPHTVEQQLDIEVSRRQLSFVTRTDYVDQLESATLWFGAGRAS